jgi:hypothetical protein
MAKNAPWIDLRRLAVALASAAALIWLGANAKADVYVIANSAAVGGSASTGGPIVTFDFTTGAIVNSFIPDQAINCPGGSCDGRAVAVLGNYVYYTELAGEGGFGPSTGIYVALYNNGAGGHDIARLPNPVPGEGIAGLDGFGGMLYAMIGYPNGPDQVQEMTGNGVKVGGLITLTTTSGGTLSDSDGFTVLPNGNFLVNDGDAINSYNQYNPTTGQEIAGTNIYAPEDASGDPCSVGANGVSSDGLGHLYFTCNFNSEVETDLNGNYIASWPFIDPNPNGWEDNSLISQAPLQAPTSAPEPPSLALLGSALVGLAWSRRRRTA